MSDARTASPDEDGTSLQEDGVSLEIRRCRPTDDVVAFAYRLRTDRNEAVPVRVHQPLPVGVGPEGVGYPTGSEDRWTLTTSGVVLEATLDPDEEPVRAVWGVQRSEHPSLEPPEIAVAPPEGADADPTDESVGDGDPSTPFDDEAGPGALPIDPVEDPDVGSPDPSPGSGRSEVTAEPVLDLDEPESGESAGDDGGAVAETATPTGDVDADDPGVELLDREPDPVSREPEPAGGSVGDEPGDSAPTVEPADDEDDTEDSPDSVVEQLAAELAAEDLEESRRRALRDALEFRLSDSTNAYVEHLQDKLERRTDRIEADVASLEESVERLHGVAAEVQDVETLKRGITQLDDRKAARSDLDELEVTLETVTEHVDATAEDLEVLREDHAALEARAATAAAVEALEDELDALDDRAASDERVDDVEAEIAELDDRAAAAERVDELAGVLETLEDDAATEANLEALRETVEANHETAASTAELADRSGELEARIDELVDDVDDLAERHTELASTAATQERFEQVEEHHRSLLNETRSEVGALEDRLEAEYVRKEAVSAEFEARFHRSVGTLALFGIGAAGLLATLPLAVAGSIAAGVTFLGGALALGTWWHLLGREDGRSADGGLGSADS